MASPSKAADSSSGQPKRSDGEQGTQGISSLSSKLSPPEKQIQEASVEAKLKENTEKLKAHTTQLFDSAAAVKVATGSSSSRPVPFNMLKLRMENPQCVLNGMDVPNGSIGKDHIHVQEENLSSGTVVFGSNGSNKTMVPLVKLPLVNKLPPYTTWISLDRNQKMAADQSVSERTRMYRAPYDNEALMCSESDEEIVKPEEQHEFLEQEDQILGDAIEEQGLHREERDETHLEKDKKHGKNPEVSEETESEGRMFREETLNTISDSFDKLFCRFCLIFGCRLHGCSQKVIVPSEKLPYVPEPEQNREPCSNQCYLSSSFGSSNEPTASDWSTLEKDLYSKGIEIFGRDSCRIARNLLAGMKTCSEVSNYMLNHEAVIPSQPGLPDSCLEESGKADEDSMEQEAPRRGRSWRKKGRARRLKKTGKSAGHPSIRKGTGGEQPACKPYAPCGCQQMCGQECRCIDGGTRCEKYCGCPKSCQNRFRGCHCSKNQCRSRQCPCFAAWRECDPDVCRNCWVSCGDGTLGEPPAHGDGGHQCGNMRVLRKQKQRILLGRSDVAGWGAFTKNPMNKNDYLGEYTGELISHQEADRRGSAYDRANSSFLFDLNDEHVVDAHRYGDKLKFANHSANPNCYAKIMMVAGDHRVAIFAKERIEAGEEIFYDYGYGPDQAPEWARRPEGSK